MGCLKLPTSRQFDLQSYEPILRITDPKEELDYNPVLNIVHKKEQTVLEPTLNVVHRKEEQPLVLTEVVVVVFENRLTCKKTVYIAYRNIQDPYNTMSYDRFGYVWNNPLMNTDPSGEIIGFLFAVVKAVRIVNFLFTAVNIVVDIAKGNIDRVLFNLGLGKLAGGISQAVSGLLNSSFVGGFVLGTVRALMNGSSIGDALKTGRITGAIVATITALETATPGAKVEAAEEGSGMGDKTGGKEFGPNGELPKVKNGKTRVGSVEPGRLYYDPTRTGKYIPFSDSYRPGLKYPFLFVRQYTTIDWYKTTGRFLQEIGDPLSYFGYALTLTVVGAEVGVPITGIGNALSTSGSIIESAGKQNWNNVGKSVGTLGVEAGARFLVNKIPYQTPQTRIILKENISFKANLFEDYFTKD